MIPMLWMPIILIIMAALMIPFVINGAGLAAAAAAAQGMGVVNALRNCLLTLPSQLTVDRSKST